MALGPLGTLEEFKSLKKVPAKKKPSTANVDATGKSTKISMTKKAAPKPTSKPTTSKSATSATRQQFNKAFAAARKEGKSTFTFQGKKFNTKVK